MTKSKKDTQEEKFLNEILKVGYGLKLKDTDEIV